MNEPLKLKHGFLYFFTAWLFIGGYYLFQIDKGDAILFFNVHRTPSLDSFFIFITKLGEVWIYVLLILSSLFIKFRYAILFGLTAILVTIISFLAKSFFQYDRPFTYFTKKGIIEQIEFIDGIYILKGTTSFPSGHTMSAFAIYGLLFLLINKNRWAFPLFILATLVGISRIYLVHHFLMDVYLGSILGLSIAYFLNYLHLNRPSYIGDWKF